MTRKTPEQIADERLWRMSDDATRDSRGRLWIRDAIVSAIEADRAQRQDPVHPDWQDDADMYRDAAVVDIRWRGWTESGKQIGDSDAGISGAQAAAMFEAIGRQS